MATFNVTTNKNFDELTSPGGGDTINISGGARLTIDTDVRYCANHSASTGPFGPVTIATATGGELYIDGTNVRLIPFSSGANNTPTIGETITSSGGATGYFLGVWSALNAAPTAAGAAMPASGWIKIKNKTGNFANGETLTASTASMTATASGADVVGWIEVVAEESTTITVPRLGKVTTRGAWYAVGSTNGAANQQIQLPAPVTGTYYAGVWIETSPSSGTYEFYPAAGTSGIGYRTDIAGKVVWISSQGLLTIGHDGTGAYGYVPSSGCAIRIPNIMLQNTTSANRSVNVIPSATAASRYEFATTLGGQVDLEKCMCAWYLNLSQAYSVSIVDTSIFELVVLTETRSRIVFNNVGFGQAYANSFTCITLTNGHSGGDFTDVWLSRAQYGVSGNYCLSMTDCQDFVFTNTYYRQFDNRGNAGVGAMLLTRCANCEWTGVETVGGKFASIVTCSHLWFENLRYCDMWSGTTPSSNGQYYFSISAKSEFITIDTIDHFGLTDVHPYTGCFQIITGSNNVKVRNIGTPAAPLSLGSNATYQTGYFCVAAAGSGLWKISFVRIYIYNTRTGIYQNCDNSVDRFEFRNCWFDAADVLIPLPFNFPIKGCKLTNTTTDQDAVYGTDWFDIFTSDTAGRLGICFNEKSLDVSFDPYEVITLGSTSGFSGAGYLALPSTADEVIYTTPYWVLGHTYFDPAEATLTGTTPNNIDLFYDIDKGSGHLGSWRNLHYKRLGGATTNTSPTITMTSTTGVSVGDLIYGTGIPAGTFIIAVVNGTTCTMSQNATATNSSLVFRFNALPMKVGVVELSFVSGGYVNAVASDIGKAVVYNGGSPTDTGTLLGFDNTNRIWWVRITDSSFTFSNTATAIAITSGTGAGTLSTAGTVNSLIDPNSGFKLRVRILVTAGVAGSLLKFLTIPTVTDATSQQAQYALDSLLAESQFNEGFN